MIPSHHMHLNIWKKILKFITKSLAYHHNLKSWDNDSMKSPPWIANLIATQEWSHELPKLVIENNGSLHNKDIRTSFHIFEIDNMIRKTLFVLITVKHNKHREERVAVHIKCVHPSIDQNHHKINNQNVFTHEKK